MTIQFFDGVLEEFRDVKHEDFHLFEGLLKTYGPVFKRIEAEIAKDAPDIEKIRGEAIAARKVLNSTRAPYVAWHKETYGE